jgi:uncharacterized membrane protein YeaQ/YmgE (transglycosylase-associated protein family)
LLSLIIFGLVVGALARVVLQGDQQLGTPVTLLAGVVGSVVGGMAGNALSTGNPLELTVTGTLVALAGAVALILVVDRAKLARG